MKRIILAIVLFSSCTNSPHNNAKSKSILIIDSVEQIAKETADNLQKQIVLIQKEIDIQQKQIDSLAKWSQTDADNINKLKR